MLERQIEKRACRNAKANGWLAFKWLSPNNRGVPDRIFIKSGVVVFVEFKAGGRGATALQAHIHRKIKAHGGKVYVVNTCAKAQEILT